MAEFERFNRVLGDEGLFDGDRLGLDGRPAEPLPDSPAPPPPPFSAS